MTLHPQAAQFLKEIEEKAPPAWSDMPLEEARLGYSNMLPYFGQPQAMHEVQTVQWTEHARARVYRPSDRRPLPVIVYFHGGGWVLGDIDTHDALCRRLANETQSCVVSVDYRLAPEAAYPHPFDDCFAATIRAAERAEEFGFDPQRIIVAGDSAGGNLAAAVAIRARDSAGPKLHAQVLIYPVVSPAADTKSYEEFATGFGLTRQAMKWFWEQYLGESAHADLQTTKPYASLLGHELAGLPPTLILTAEYDVLRDEGEAFAASLASANVRGRSKRYPGMLHAFLHLSSLFDSAETAFADITDFLRSLD
ncbi:alpha/beta hydrolase [Aureliella helgolandensis]|uniref:Carboxylesterase NlhH n=1 Tax=Aureliella helgolandensis TaxID=2527968 RepID=A0A518G6Q6_9BACT|nr:alpha/beta hydrolase [Aureliella helgolandensis]QDV24266.1 Carboxylesterase NlhH [Aureliella helgolandensis]